MKRIVLTKNLFLRSGRPHTQASASGVLHKSRIIPYLKLVKGENHKGIDDWYEVFEQEYIWAGGAEPHEGFQPQSWKFSIQNPTVIEKAERLSENVRELGIPLLWDLYESSPVPQRKVKVAVLDSGVDPQNSFLRDKLKDSKCFNARRNVPTFEEAEGIDNVLDDDGHGTFCAGILAADSPPFMGAAYECDLHIVKVTLGMPFGVQKEDLERAVDWCVHKKVDIISFSFSMKRDRYEADGFESCIRKARAHNIIWVASIGNDENQIGFPGGSSSCIGVGAIDASIFKGDAQSTFLPKDFVFAPSVEVLAPEFLSQELREKFRNPKGSSFATPIATGCVALIHALSRTKDPDTIKRIMQENTIQKIVTSRPQNTYPVIHFETPVIV